MYPTAPIDSIATLDAFAHAHDRARYSERLAESHPPIRSFSFHCQVYSMMSLSVNRYCMVRALMENRAETGMERQRTQNGTIYIPE